MEAGCGSCHTLANAGGAGTIGPNLDTLKPKAATVQQIVRTGRGGMPAFAGRLSDEQIAEVARFVESSGGG